MDCQRCDEGLIDFLYGELDELTAAAFRRHLDGCSRCSAAAEELKETQETFAGLPLEQPSPSLDDIIMQAAREAAASEGEKAASEESRQEPTWLEKLAAGLRTMAWQPTFAVIVVAISVGAAAIFFLQQGPGRPQDSEALSMVPPEELQSTEEAEEQSEPPAPVTVTENEPEPQEAAQQEPVDDQIEPTPPVEEDRIPAVAETRGMPAKSRGQYQNEKRRLEESNFAPAAKTLSTGQAGQGPIVVNAQPVTDPMPVPTEQERIPQPGQAAGPWAQPPPLPRATPMEVPANRQQQPTSSEQTGAQDQHIQLTEPAVQSPSAPADLVPSGLMQTARNFRSVNPNAAVQQYERILREFPTFSQRNQAMLEAARVHMRLGNFARARALLTTLEGRPGWAGRARQELINLETRQRAQDPAPAAMEMADDLESVD